MPKAPTLTSSPTVRVSLAAHVVGLSAILFIILASAFGWSDHYRWTADVATLTMAKPWDGMLSSLGMIVWSSAVAISVFVAATWWKESDERINKLLAAAAFVTAVLLVDDLFMFHDEVLPQFMGVPEKVATIGVALFPLALLWFFRSTILKTPWRLLAIGVGYLAFMAVVDTLEHSVTIPAHHVWEEGAKFLGILHWCGYVILLAWGQARSVTVEERGISARISLD
ncbi:hypothetical protein [Serinicoccus sp. LYQ131]|uniref:hypothetical protein n=1 Tax=Serinicoccus sp. LYQ131 TaxID=3378797 RepID=UPI003851C7C0